MHILGMLRWLVRCMSRPVQNHLDSYKMYNQILQCLLINFILYLNINLKNILKLFTPRPLPTKSAEKSFSNYSKWFVPGRPWTPLYAPVHPCVKTWFAWRARRGSAACHIIFREFRYLSMQILLGMIRWPVRCMSRPVHNHLPIVIKYTINI